MKFDKSILVASFFLIALMGTVRTASAQDHSLSVPSLEQKLDTLIQKLSALEKRWDQVEEQLNNRPKATDNSSEAPPALATTDLAAQIEALGQRIRIAERQREPGQGALAAKSETAPVLVAGPGGFAM